MRALALLVVLLPALAPAEEKTAVHIPQTPDDPTAQATAKLLADRCEEGETLAVFPPVGKQSWSGDWGRFSAVCTRSDTGAQRGFDVYVRRPPESAADLVFADEGMSRAQLRRVLEATKPDVRAALKVVVFATKALTGNVLDGAGPEPGAERPRREGDALLFQLSDLRKLRVELTGEGPIEVSPR